MRIANIMEKSSNSEENTECDSITALELQKFKRVLYFSDGVMEELSESDEENNIGTDTTDRSLDVDINMKTLPLGSRIKYQAYQIGSRFLNGVDYIGEGLASFFGITTPKYMTESDIDDAKKVDAQSNNLNNLTQNNDNWHHNNNINTSNIVITRYPRSSVNTIP